MSWTNLEDKTIIVTGGAAGIGLAVTKGFVEVGAKVMIADFAEDVGKRPWKKPIRLKRRSGFGGVTLLRRPRSMLSFKQRSTGGAVDALVNNAGINAPRLLVDPAGKEELTEEVWDKVFAVNEGPVFVHRRRPVKCSPVVEAV